MREFLVPVSILLVIFSLVVPLPAELIDIMLVANLVLGLIVLVSTFYIQSPLKFTVLPSLLLLVTIYRLALNISTTRMILGSGSTGKMLEAFGNLIINGNLLVGAVIFLVITLVQFIVIAKGAERVAEVAARFTLDALPGKQMSIDADMRSGLIDIQTAKKLREDLQAESRFYGALDGAMKFVKGDAIAGLVIIAVNIIGGLIVGVAVNGLDLTTALSRYTLLTIGEGLLSQIPALLTALSAGMVVTRVARTDSKNISMDLLKQLGQIKTAKVLIACLCGILAIVMGPAVPFFIMGGVLLVSILATSTNEEIDSESLISSAEFRPRLPSIFSITLSSDLKLTPNDAKIMTSNLKQFQSDIFNDYGVILPPPLFNFKKISMQNFELFYRDVSIGIKAFSNNANYFVEPLNEIKNFVGSVTSEIIDDNATRRLLEFLEKDYPDLVSSVIPEIISVTQLTTILRQLVVEKVKINNLDLILQAIAEHGGKTENERTLYEKVRKALSRFICESISNKATIKAFSLDPIIDFALVSYETEHKNMPDEILRSINLFTKSIQDVDKTSVVCTELARRPLKDTFSLCNCNINVISYNEIVTGYKLEIIDEIKLSSDSVINEVLENV